MESGSNIPDRDCPNVCFVSGTAAVGLLVVVVVVMVVVVMVVVMVVDGEVVG